METTWSLVPGGVCAYGDRGPPVRVRPLWWTTTLAAQGQLGLAAGDATLPAVHLNHAEVRDVASTPGGRLPRSVEWEWMAAGPSRRRYPWGTDEWTPGLANLRDSGPGGPTPVACYPDGATPEGVLDVAGNVWEWTASVVLGDGAILRGGSYHSPPLYATCSSLNAAPQELRSAGIGVRVVREA